MRRIAVVALVALAACGDAPTPRQGASECPVLDADHPVTLTTPFGERDLATEWDASEPGVELELTQGPPGPLETVDQLHGDDAPMLTTLADWIVPLAERLEVVETSTPCFPPTRLFITGWLMAYDRAAFVRAGLDPDAPPTTLAELHAAGVALRDNAGYASPISWRNANVALYGLDIPSDAARRAARSFVQLGNDGLLLRLDEPPALPPIGSGAAAIELVRDEDVWLLADAIADGQAPDADLGVAPVPGLDGPVAAVETFDWVVASGTTPEEQVAAAAFLDWVGEPEQLLRLHRKHGLLPKHASVVDTDGFRAYWAERPLLRAAWDAMNDAPAPGPSASDQVAGSWSTVGNSLDGIIAGVFEFDAEWGDVENVIERAKAAQAHDALALIRCLLNPAAQPGEGRQELWGCV